MTKNIRSSNSTYMALVRIQKALREQKGEDHKLIAIQEKVVVNADLKRLYGITVDMGETETLEHIS